jgi:hypothetical protein
MPRTTPDIVRETFDTEAPDAALNQWIAQASVLVDDVENRRPPIDDGRLKQIETLLAQHFLTAQDPRYSSMSGGARDADFGEGRTETAYLDRAKRLDPTGLIGESLTGDDLIITNGRSGTETSGTSKSR